MTENVHLRSIETPIPKRDWASIRGELSVYLLFLSAVAGAVLWYRSYELQRRQIEISEKQQHILELYARVLQKDIDDFKAEVRSAHNPRTPDTHDTLPDVE